MTAIFALIENTEKMRKYLFWYLMIIPALLLLWIVLGAANSQMDFQARPEDSLLHRGSS